MLETGRSFPFLKDEKDSLVFLGESGSGKTEIAIESALSLAGQDRSIHFFDMDQTKPLFRSRDVFNLLESRGITVHQAHSVLDAPTIPDGILTLVEDHDTVCIFDVGGNINGARMMGQFHDAWKGRVNLFFMVNVYRSFISTAEELHTMFETLSRAAGLDRWTVIANPNFGQTTTADQVDEGYRKTEILMKGIGVDISHITVLDSLTESVREILPGVEIIPLHRYMLAPWEHAN